MNRFLKPKQLDDDQREVVAEALSRLDVGDAEGRRIFVYALDYELTEYVNYLNKTPRLAEKPAPVIPVELEEMHESLKQLLANLQNLTDHNRTQLCDRLTANDVYRRSYSDQYLDALSAELARMQAACDDLLRHPTHESQSPVERPESEFVRMLANAYSECFEEPPKPTESGAFAQLLELIGEQIGLDLKFDAEALKVLLSSYSLRGSV